jgi:hypothetical protein
MAAVVAPWLQPKWAVNKRITNNSVCRRYSSFI